MESEIENILIKARELSVMIREHPIAKRYSDNLDKMERDEKSLVLLKKLVAMGKELEEKSAKFYEDLSQNFSKDEDVLLSYAKENKKFFTQIQRAYYSVITDALEGCFAFDLEADDYALETDLPAEVSYSDAVAKAIEMEERILDFYAVAAEQSMSLMADVPRNFFRYPARQSGLLHRVHR